MDKKIGTNQQRIIANMSQFGGYWYSGCGWVCGTYAKTERIMQSLVVRGLVIAKPWLNGKTHYSLIK